MERLITKFVTTIGDLQWSIGNLKNHSEKGTLLNAVRLLLCWDNPAFLKACGSKLSENEKVTYCNVYVRGGQQEHVLDFCDLTFGELNNDLKDGFILFDGDKYLLKRANWVLTEKFDKNLEIWFNTEVKFPAGRFPIIQHLYEQQEFSFPVKQILQVMGSNYASRFTCHAISYIMSGQDISNCVSSHEYRAPYLRMSSDIFSDEFEEISKQVIAQMHPFVDYDGRKLSAIDLDSSFKEWVDRAQVLRLMIAADPNAAIKINMNLPANFENFFKG